MNATTTLTLLLLCSFPQRSETIEKTRLKKSRQKTQVAARSENGAQNNIQGGTVSKEEAQLTAKPQEQEMSKKPGKLYQYILAFQGTVEILLL